MYEEYLEDAYHFYVSGSGLLERDTKRNYRAAVFYSFSALESFVNFMGDTLEKGGAEEFEIAFLTDRKFGIDGDKFTIMEKSEYHRIEDKLRFIIEKYCKGIEIIGTACWQGFKDFKSFRDSIVHPRNLEDDITISIYEEKVQKGMNSILELINQICLGFFKKPLRRKVLELQV